MPFNDIYACRIITTLRGIHMLNTFHFAAKGDLATAGAVVDELKSNVVPRLKFVTSAWTQFTEVNATIVSNQLQDNFSVLLENEFGFVPATGIDPRIGVWIQTRSAFTNSPYGTGGFCYGGTPINWTGESPRVHDLCVEAWVNFRTFMFTFYRIGVTAPNLEWGVFSRSNFSRFPEDRAKWWFPVTHMHIRPYFVSRRTRRPRLPV